MNPDVRSLLVEELRSGKYRQGRNVLRRSTLNGPDVLCCLGVLCEAAIAEDVEVTRDAPETPGGHYEYQHSDTYPPPVVNRWAGVDDPEGSAGHGYYVHQDIVRRVMGEGDTPLADQKGNVHLTTMNDTGFMTFDQIADVIEEDGREQERRGLGG